MFFIILLMTYFDYYFEVAEIQSSFPHKWADVPINIPQR